jgi:predicted transcriptional regulator
MQVTSIRLEQDLKEQLKILAGQQGYQALIREILWNYVNRQSARPQTLEIRATLAATAESPGHCAVTGQPISAGESILLGLTPEGTLVTLSARQGLPLIQER